MIQLTEIAPGVWLLQSERTGLNTGVVLGEGAAMLVDPGAPDGELTALESFAREAERPVAAIAITHNRHAEPPDLSRWAAAERISAPDLWGASLIGEGTSVALPVAGWEAVPMGGPHGLGVYNPRERVLFSGAVLADSDIPRVEGSSQAYLEALAALEKLAPRLVVPAGGAVLNGKREIRGRIERDRSYIYSLHRHVLTSMAGNITLDRALEVARTVYKDYPFMEKHVGNVQGVWGELENK